jgi:hypothetical protein
MFQYRTNNYQFIYLKHNIETVNAQSALVHLISGIVIFTSFLVKKSPWENHAVRTVDIHILYLVSPLVKCACNSKGENMLFSESYSLPCHMWKHFVWRLYSSLRPCNVADSWATLGIRHCKVYSSVLWFASCRCIQYIVFILLCHKYRSYDKNIFSQWWLVP